MQQLHDDASDALTEQLDSLYALIETTQRRLNVRQRQVAIYGIAVDPSIIIESEDLERQLDTLNRQLDALLGSEPRTTPAPDNWSLMSSKALPDVPLPELDRPPTIADFIGRTADLAYFSEKLNSTHIAVITGLAGVGKTTLAAELAQRSADPDRIFWHSFHEHEGVDAIIWKLAGFLAHHSQPELLRLLHSSRRPGGQALPPEVLFDYLLQAVRYRGYLLCLDDFQFVDDDPLLDHLARRLQGEVLSGSISLVITSRRIPSFVQTVEFAPLPGLSSEDADRLLESRELVLDDDLAARLYAHTGGNPQLLTLAIDALRHAPNPARLIDRLAEAEHIERYLLAELDARLTDDERAVMGAVAALLGFPGTCDAIEAMLEKSGLRRMLSELSTRYLLTVTEGLLNREYSQHAIVQSFYYGLLGKRERMALHLRAATFYEAEEFDPLRGARHFARIGEHNHATRLVTAVVEPLVNQGHARAVLRLLDETPTAALELALQMAAAESCGDLQYLLGELDGAIARYDQALTAADQPLAQARLLRKLGEVLARRGKNDEALARLEQSRMLIGDVNEDADECARLSISYGTVLWSTSRYDEAATVARDGLAALGEELVHSGIAADLHDLLGKVQFQRGDFAGSYAQFQDALHLRKDATDQRGMIKSYSNIAVVLGRQNRYIEALQSNEAALKIAEQIGDTIALDVLYRNMAVDYAHQEEFDRSIDLNQRAIVLCERIGNLRGQAVAYHNLGDLYRRLTQFELATGHLTRSIELARSIGDQHGVIAATEALAEVRLVEGDTEAALSHAQTAIELSEQSGDSFYQPWLLHLLGRIQHIKGHPDESRALFEAACQIWRERDIVLELSNTLLSWTLLEQDARQISRARELCAEAAVLAERCAAKHLIDQAARLLAALNDVLV